MGEGGFKLFGKHGQWPETIRQGHKRSIVRVETYIEQSATNRQNYIIVSHAPAVAAMFDIFQRGLCDVQRLNYCARVIAKRSVRASTMSEEHGVYAEQWDVDSKGVDTELNLNATEEAHLTYCDEAQSNVANRRENRTKTDFVFDKTLVDLVRQGEEQEA